jgi:hypothetical protein
VRRAFLLVLCVVFAVSGTLLVVTGRMGETSGFASDESENSNGFLTPHTTPSQNASRLSKRLSTPALLVTQDQ